MKPVFVFFCLLFFIFYGCEKHRVLKRIDGTWEITGYKQTYIDGTSLYIESEGTLAFTDYKPRKSENGNYSMDQYYTIGNTTTHLSETGTYRISDKGKDIYINVQNPDGSFQNVRNYTITLITSTDLRLEVVFNDVFHTYILRKL